MKTTLKILALTGAVVCFSNCTTIVDPGISTSPSTASTTTTQATTSSPYYSGDSVTTKKTTTTYR